MQALHNGLMSNRPTVTALLVKYSSCTPLEGVGFEAFKSEALGLTEVFYSNKDL